MYTVSIRDGDALTVKLGETILSAALRSGLDVPHRCQAGICGACKGRLHDGEVEMTPYSDFALSEGEKANGLILACRAVPWSDCDISILAEDDRVMHPQRDMRCTVTAVEAATHDIRVVRVRVDAGGPYDFSAGQYADIEVAGLPARSYSMANRPEEGELEFHVRLVEGGAMSGYIVHHLRPGEGMRVKGPKGDAYLRDSHKGPMLCVAGGSGLAPIKAIVETALARDPEREIHLYFGARDERDVYLEDHFRALAERHPGLRYTIVLSHPMNGTTRRTGWVTEAVAADLADLAGFKAYLCGPPPMVEAGQRLLRDRGVAAEHVHADAFYTVAEQMASLPMAVA